MEWPSHHCCIVTPKKDFDTADQILLIKLYHYGIRGVANGLLKSYLNNRKQLIFVNQQRSNLKMWCPSRLHTQPWLQSQVAIFIYDLPVITTSESYLFADDIVLLLSHCNTAQLELKMCLEPQKIQDWMNANKLTTNTLRVDLRIYRTWISA